MLAPDEFGDWKTHPVTQMYYKYLKEMRATLLEDWATGLFTSETAEGTAQKNAVAIGQVRLIEDLLNLTEEHL